MHETVVVGRRKSSHRDASLLTRPQELVHRERLRSGRRRRRNKVVVLQVLRRCPLLVHRMRSVHVRYV